MRSLSHSFLPFPFRLFFAFYLRTHSCETSPIIATNGNFFIESEHESKVKKQKSRQHFDTNKKRTKQTKNRRNREGRERVEKDLAKVAAGQKFFQICHNFRNDEESLQLKKGKGITCSASLFDLTRTVASYSPCRRCLCFSIKSWTN